MECRVCGGLVEWRSVACDQTQCRRCGATDSQVEEEEQDEDAAPTVEEAAANDGGPTEALRRIASLDWTHAAINGAAREACRIATEAVRIEDERGKVQHG